MRPQKNFITDESGATAVEYGLLAAIISVALLVGYGAVTGSLMNVLDTVNTAIQTAGT